LRSRRSAPEKIQRSAIRKFAIASVAIARMFATTTFIPSHRTYAAVNATVPAIDVEPVVPAKAHQRLRTPLRPRVRSAHVHRSCQTKLCRTAVAAARPVASRSGDPAARSMARVAI
jgi:hypothetical protein